MQTVHETIEFRKIIKHIDQEISKTQCLNNNFYELIKSEELPDGR